MQLFQTANIILGTAAEQEEKEIDETTYGVRTM